jgi:hypothetical protein
VATTVTMRFNRTLVLAGVLLLVFGIVGLSGPGRIDIVDGQARFEVARSLALHGDVAVRNPDLWFTVFPGRHGQRFSNYRFPHSVVGAGAILLADATGPDRDARRQFFFAMTSAAAAAGLAAVYVVWFGLRGLPPGTAVFWALAGIFCTPSYFYGTSTFDDIFAALAGVGALVASSAARRSASIRSALWCGLLFGLAFNVKQPLLAFALPGLALLDRTRDVLRSRVGRLAAFAAGIAAGAAAYWAFEYWKFPPETRALQAVMMQRYAAPFPGHFFWGAAVLTLSPSAGVFLYAPALALSLSGLKREATTDRRFGLALALAGLAFFAFFAAVSFTKGDPAWGPRYLTPLLAVLWLLAPSGAARWSRRGTAAVLGFGLAVQILALTVEPERMHIQRGLPSTFGITYPQLYFDIRNADLFVRPSQIADVWRTYGTGTRFVWSSPATSMVNITTRDVIGEHPMRTFRVLNLYRPWWVTIPFMPQEDRPVEMRWALVAAFTAIVLGASLIAAGLRKTDGVG